jgi:hypothetical protein
VARLFGDMGATPSMANPDFEAHFGGANLSPVNKAEILVESDTLFGTPKSTPSSTSALKSALKSTSFNTSGSMLKKEVKISPKLRVKDQEQDRSFDMMDDILGPVGKPFSPKIERVRVTRSIL